MEYITDKEMDGSPCCQQGFTWNTFFNQTTKALHGNELCDCWRKLEKDGSFLYAVENRRYYHQELQTHLIFLWIGSTPIYMRKEFASFPFQPICNISLPSCLPNTSLEFDILTVAQMVKNATISFHPDLFIMNWGHHRNYDFKINEMKGKFIYESLNETLTELKLSSRYNHTRFVFKMTNPFCERPYRQLKHPGGSNLYCLLHPVKLSPLLVSEKLIAEQNLERFDMPGYVTALANALPSFRNPKTGDLTISRYTPIEEAAPIYWDNVHPYCWIMTQLNKVMIAKYFTSSEIVGITATSVPFKLFASN
jgi:hypothetical protein